MEQPIPTSFSSGQELTGKIALVTGAGINIGRATALALAAAGATVAVNTRASREAAESVVQEIRAAGGQAECYLADVADAAHQHIASGQRDDIPAAVGYH